MSGLLVSLQGAVAQGVLWGIMVLGVYITFRLMDIADMTVDGSFALGACVCAVLVVNKGVNPVLALLVAAVAGVVAGAVTGILHTVFEIPAILAGILTQISLWSINLRIMGGSPGELTPRCSLLPLCVDLLDPLHHLEQPCPAGDTIGFQRGRNGQADCLLSAPLIRHHQVRGHGVQPTLYAFHTCVK